MKPRLLDLFCCAGGAGRGYADAGFDVTGVDIDPQPNYPFRFVQSDAIVYLDRVLRGELHFDAIHASPPCQGYANVTKWTGNQADHPKLIAPVRERLSVTGVPWVMENVRTDELRSPIVLCGSMFDLPLRRHRYFETSWPWFELFPPCQHRRSDYSFDHGGKQPESVYRDAMGCGWMTAVEARQAIPPAYTKFLGRQLLGQLSGSLTLEETP